MFPCFAKSQDTSFVYKHFFQTPVRNVFSANNEVYAKTGDGLYKLQGSIWKKQKTVFGKTYVFYDKDFYEADYIPDRYIFRPETMAYLIPQKSITSATKANLDDRFFVAAGGSLFEYVLNNNYKHLYANYSIRDIFIDDEIKVLSTYSGIFINDTLKASSPGYSNGYLRKIRNQYYLSADHLYAFTAPSEFRKIPAGDNVFAGYSRKLLEFRNNVYSLNTKSVNIMDSSFELKPIHQGFEYYDMEVVGDKLIFCTQTGEVFVYDGQKVQLLVKLKTRIRDIYQFKNTVYLSSNEGVFTINGLDASTLSLFSKTPFTVMVLVDALRNTWISTENGLYVLPDKQKESIPYIKEVEFNRGALTLYNDTVYAGSISGLYVIDCYHVVKSFLPVYLNKMKRDNTEHWKNWGFYGAGLIFLLVGLGIAYRAKFKQKAELIIPQKETSSAPTLGQIADAIRTHNIMTVEGLADYYKTNTVQLNRQFKVFETTPGKFMKTVKINYARELLKNKILMDEVVRKVGYSAIFIKKELNI